MAGIVVLALFITTSLSVIEAEVPVTAKLSARRDGPVNLDPESCVPGKFYQGPGCGKCFCNAEKRKICSPPGTCKLEGEGADKVLTQGQLIHTFNRGQLYLLPSLPNNGAKCNPGVSYRVDCNRCICGETKSLMCEELLCPTNDEINKRQAMELSGKPCDEVDVKTQECVKCTCNNGKYSCEAKDDCISSVALLNLQRGTTKKQCFPGRNYSDPTGGPPCTCTIYGKLNCPTTISPRFRNSPSKMGPQMTLRGKLLHSTRTPGIITIPYSPENEMPFDKALLDPKSNKKCVPNMVYRDKCNRCICSAARTLRCTAMVCVNEDTGLLPWQTTRKRKLIGSRITEEFSNRRAKCIPGSTFRHECDTCVCDNSGALRCTNAVCPNAEKKGISKSEYDEGFE